MKAKMMLQIRKTLKNEGVNFCYSGYMTEDMLLGIGSVLKKQMACTELGKKKGKSLFSVVVEQMQNVMHFSAERLREAGQSDLCYGVIAVGESGYKMFASCGCILHATDAVLFTRYLDNIQHLDGTHLKSMWKDTLRHVDEQCPQSQDACVSFIEITRRAKGDIEYEFVKISEKWMFFNLKAYL